MLVIPVMCSSREKWRARRFWLLAERGNNPKTKKPYKSFAAENLLLNNTLPSTAAASSPSATPRPTASSPATTGTAHAGPNKRVHIGLWVVQGLLAFAFGAAGAMKLAQPIDALVSGGLVWASSVPEALVRFIGASELLGGVGMILPAATRIAPRLTPLAGAGLVIVMALALAFHVSRGELGALPVNLVLGGLAGFVAYGRTKLAPIAPRG